MRLAYYPTLTAEQASAELTVLGVPVAPEEVRVVAREGRWLVRIPGERIAWFAATGTGLAALTRERRVLRILALRCRFRAPRVLLESSDGAVDVRTVVPGMDDAEVLLHRACGEPGVAVRIGADLGAILADLHLNVAAEEVAGWLPGEASWPEPRAWVQDRLPDVVDDPGLHAEADAVMARYEEAQRQIGGSDRVLVHTDLGFHNLSVDPVALHVNGVFDWETACWADRHLDFRYFEFDLNRLELLEAALAVYEPLVGCRLSRARIFLYNAASAISYLAFRAGVPPDERWCGRTLAEDLRWTRHAIARVLAPLSRR